MNAAFPRPAAGRRCSQPPDAPFLLAPPASRDCCVSRVGGAAAWPTCMWSLKTNCASRPANTTAEEYWKNNNVVQKCKVGPSVPPSERGRQHGRGQQTPVPDSPRDKRRAAGECVLEGDHWAAPCASLLTSARANVGDSAPHCSLVLRPRHSCLVRGNECQVSIVAGRVNI